MKTTYKVITKSGAVNLPSKSQVRHYVRFLHALGLHNRNIAVEEVMSNE